MIAQVNLWITSRLPRKRPHLPHPRLVTTVSENNSPLHPFTVSPPPTPDFPRGSAAKSPPAKAAGTGDTCLIPGLGRSSGGGNGNPLQYSYLGNSIDRGTWWATLHGVTEVDTTEHAHTYIHTHTHTHTHTPAPGSVGSRVTPCLWFLSQEGNPGTV